MQIYNYRLSRMRRLIENAFGIMAATFRVYGTKFLVQPDKVEKIVLATTVLHNFLRCHHQPTNFTTDTDTELGSWRDVEQHGMGDLPHIARRGTEDAKSIRDEFRKYFNNEGAVGWQENMIL